MQILVVEDERKVAQFIERGSKEERYAVNVPSDGEDALFLFQSNDYDLIVLDLLMPKKDGFQVLSERDATLRRLAFWLAICSVAALLLAWPGLDYLIRQWCAPLAAFSETARKVDLCNLSHQRLFVPPDAPELAELASTYSSSTLIYADCGPDALGEEI